MSKHDFSLLFDQYPAIIAQMPPVFASHQFILRLAQQQQVPYIEAWATSKARTSSVKLKHAPNGRRCEL